MAQRKYVLIVSNFFNSLGLSLAEISRIFIAILFPMVIIMALTAYIVWLKKQGKSLDFVVVS